GRAALEVNTSGSKNTASGYLALGANTMGNFNTATGGYALAHNTIGSNNIAVGLKAGSNLTTGSNNIDIGNLGVTGESQTLRIGTTGTQTNAYAAGNSGVTFAEGSGDVIDPNGHLVTTVS